MIDWFDWLVDWLTSRQLTFQRRHLLLGRFSKCLQPFEDSVIAFYYDVFIYLKGVNFRRRNSQSEAKLKDSTTFGGCYWSQFMYVRCFPTLHNRFTHDNVCSSVSSYFAPASFHNGFQFSPRPKILISAILSAPASTVASTRTTVSFPGSFLTSVTQL